MGRHTANDERQIILPVVERSVTIAGISTRELVAKDFVTEPSEDKLRKAGHLMAQKLAGSLALVTCKEPLKGNLGSHIRHFLAEFGFGEVSSSCSMAHERVLNKDAPDGPRSGCFLASAGQH